MRSLRVLHIDDDPSLRDIVELSLSFDPAFTPASCACGRDALELAADWQPDLVLCDVMMPEMDGPATLARLREMPGTAKVPVMFMTANPGESDIAHYKALGAAAVIAKPFDPKTFADTVRARVSELPHPPALRAPADELEEFDDQQIVYLGAAGDDFTARLRTDAITFRILRAALGTGEDDALERMQSLAHKLAGAAAIFGFPDVSDAARALEAAIIAGGFGRNMPAAVEEDLIALIECIERERPPVGGLAFAN